MTVLRSPGDSQLAPDAAGRNDRVPFTSSPPTAGAPRPDHDARGEIRTPAFMPVGTAGTVKAMTSSRCGETGADILLGNTYHLMLRPGAERVARLGGLHSSCAGSGRS